MPYPLNEVFPGYTCCNSQEEQWEYLVHIASLATPLNLSAPLHYIPGCHYISVFSIEYVNNSIKIGIYSEQQFTQILLKILSYTYEFFGKQAMHNLPAKAVLNYVNLWDKLSLNKQQILGEIHLLFYRKYSHII